MGINGIAETDQLDMKLRISEYTIVLIKAFWNLHVGNK